MSYQAYTAALTSIPSSTWIIGSGVLSLAIGLSGWKGIIGIGSPTLNIIVGVVAIVFGLYQRSQGK